MKELTRNLVVLVSLGLSSPALAQGDDSMFVHERGGRLYAGDNLSYLEESDFDGDGIIDSRIKVIYADDLQSSVETRERDGEIYYVRKSGLRPDGTHIEIVERYNEGELQTTKKRHYVDPAYPYGTDKKLTEEEMIYVNGKLSLIEKVVYKEDGQSPRTVEKSKIRDGVEFIVRVEYGEDDKSFVETREVDGEVVHTKSLQYGADGISTTEVVDDIDDRFDSSTTQTYGPDGKSFIFRKEDLSGTLETSTALMYSSDGNSVVYIEDRDGDGKKDYSHTETFRFGGRLSVKEIDTDGDGNIDWKKRSLHLST